MRKLSQGLFEFSRSHIQEVVKQDIKTGILIAVYVFNHQNTVTHEKLALMAATHPTK